MAAILALTAAGCAGAGSGSDGDERLRPIYDQRTGRLSELTYDTNGDGAPDIRVYMDGPQVVRAEVDEDGDGRLDRWEYYARPEAGQGAPAGRPLVNPRPPLARVEISSNRNGKTTRREFYQRGVLSRVEEDTNEDGRIDRWEIHENGVLHTLALDLIRRGSPQQRLFYNAEGDVTHVEIDPDGDGRFEPSPRYRQADAGR
jgi:hypothetical protein